SAPDALRILKKKNIDLPFIVISGTIGEDVAVDMMKNGAHDYLLKNNLIRLCVAIDREMKEAHNRSQRRLAQEELKKLKDELEEKVEQRTKDLMLSQEKLMQAGRLALIGQITAGVAHEINNPLGFVKSNISRLEEYLDILSDLKKEEDVFKEVIKEDDKEKTRMFLNQIFKFEKQHDIDFLFEDYKVLLKEVNHGINRIQKIISDLMGFAHKENEIGVEINIHKILDAAIEFLSNDMKYKCQVNKEYGRIPMVKGSAHKMEQVFVNIIMNAIQSIEKNGKIFISTSFKDNKVYITIEDNGKGIAKENLEKIFEPFFTTKKAGIGTGLGLSLTYDIVRSHNGNILVESEEEKGTKFTVIIPA
ncbi:MAG: ATP-binding protein, partial [Candidatus Omnitrophica bacterium]|nr:ATP-binding protein [Candidatus Omnitrophota bacterium]